MTSWQEQERLKVLEKRREEHEQYAAERLAKVNEICTLACKHGMSYGKYMIERDKIMEEENKVTQTQTAEEAPRKHGIREPLTAEKISEVQSLIDSGATIAETAEQAGVGKSTVSRIKSGAYGVKQPKKPPKAAEPAVFTALEVSKSDKRDILRRLILEVKCCLSSAPTFEDKEEGYVLGLLTAAELILGDNAKI